MCKFILLFIPPETSPQKVHEVAHRYQRVFTTFKNTHLNLLKPDWHTGFTTTRMCDCDSPIGSGNTSTSHPKEETSLEEWVRFLNEIFRLPRCSKIYLLHHQFLGIPEGETFPPFQKSASSISELSPLKLAELPEDHLLSLYQEITF